MKKMKPNYIDDFCKKVLKSNSNKNNNSNNTNHGILNDNFDNNESSDDEDYVLSEKSDHDETDNSETSSNIESELEDVNTEEENANTISTDGPHNRNEKSPKKQKSNLEINDKSSQKNDSNVFKKICCVCLNEQSESFDEVVECDSCGFFTHEGCYGINDSDSKHSSDSIASTEPWFCNSCFNDDHIKENGHSSISLSKEKIRNCELCPNLDCGLLKETECGRFVHIVCALYLPDVSFEDTDNLWPVVLSEIPAKKWGEKVCSLCDNVFYSRTGVCIKCDAGLCKAYFHATCALKHGLTADPMQQNVYDSFFAYCKQHNDSTVVKQRKTKYAAMISSFNSNSTNYNENKNRLKMKFEEARINYQLKRKLAQIPRKEQKKTTRMFTSCPSAVKHLMIKNTFINETDEQVKQVHLTTQQRHSTYAINFTPDFVKYFYERETKIEQFKKELPDLQKTQSELTSQEALLVNRYELKMEKYKNLTETFEKDSKLLSTCICLIEKTSSKSKIPTSLNRSLNIVQINEEKDTQIEDDIDSNLNMNNSSYNNSSRRSSIATLNTSKRTYVKRKSSFCENILNLDAECSVCKQKTNSHLLVICDTCKIVYHISCLEPPLTAVPKKTKLYGWECAKCVRKKDSDYEESEEREKQDDAGKRTLRRERKQTRSGIQDILEMEHLIKLVKQKSKKGRKKKTDSKPIKYVKKINKENKRILIKREHSDSSQNETINKKFKNASDNQKKSYYTKKKLRNKKESPENINPLIESIIESVIADSINDRQRNLVTTEKRESISHSSSSDHK